MATYRKQKGKTQAIIRRDGYPRQAKTFSTKTAAVHWATEIENAMNLGVWVDPRKISLHTLGDVIQMNLDIVHSVKPFDVSKLNTLKLTQREIGHITLRDLTSDFLLSYVKRRRLTVEKSQMRQQLSYISKCLDTAVGLWGFPMEINPIKTLRPYLYEMGLIGDSNKRSRRPTDDELQAILDDCKKRRHWLETYITLAVDTAMRQEEIHKLIPSDLVFFDKPKGAAVGTILIRNRKDPKKKAGNDQVIPMFKVSREVFLREIERNPEGLVVNGPKKPGSISDGFGRVAARLGIEDLHFHDLRHESISRLFEAGHPIQKVAMVSGHKDWRQLQRYVNLKPEEF